MLVLSRKIGETIEIGDNVVVTLVRLNGDRARIGIEAPRDVVITRPDAKKGPRVEVELPQVLPQAESAK